MGIRLGVGDPIQPVASGPMISNRNRAVAEKAPMSDASANDPPGFGFERLDVYQCSIEFLSLASLLSEGLPRGHSALGDQLRRAALSIPLNIAEGAGRIGEADVSRHRAIARGSAMECAAILDVLRVLGLAPTDQLRQSRSLLLRIVSMLSKLCRGR